MKENHFSRFVIIAVICGLFGLAIVIQMIRINYSTSAMALIQKSERYQGIEQTIYPPRGTIFDRTGNILATNHVAYEVGVDLNIVEDPESIAYAAASLMGLDYKEVLDIASSDPEETGLYYVILENFVSEETVKALFELKEGYLNQRLAAKSTKPSLTGLVWTPQQKRVYPEGQLAANLLGFYNYFSRETAQGVFGVEEAYNRLLSGVPEQVYLPYDPYLVEALPNVNPGANLVLTIDREIQSMLEITLTNALEWSGAEGGTIIVADPETGEILGMASTPFFDPNQYWDYDQTFPSPTPYNRAVGQAYEPGSVFKIITMAAALDSGAAQPSTTYVDSSGVYWVDGLWPIYNWDGGAWGEQDMTGCMQHSLNVCLAHIACDLLGEEQFYAYVQAFGFGRSTGVDLAGEANFPLRLPENNQWAIVDLATNSFGQGIAVTPIQMVTAISAVANDGRMMTPHLVKSVVDQGRQYDIAPQTLGTPISAETAQTLTQMLAVALEEEASDALVEGYSLAGKTGTGEIPTELGYTSELTNTSFVGWGPADDPKFIVYVWLEKPEISKWGSEVAAPVFHDVVQELVVLMRIPPDVVRLQTTTE
jgi:cell division protein FtsI/penicillin-binding protein 2